jgi:hypothetical protein
MEWRTRSMLQVSLPMFLILCSAVLPRHANAALNGTAPALLEPKVRGSQSLQGRPDVPPTVGILHPNQLHRARFMVGHPTLPGVYWVATIGSGVWKTADGVRTWVPKNNGLRRFRISFASITTRALGRTNCSRIP